MNLQDLQPALIVSEGYVPCPITIGEATYNVDVKQFGFTELEQLAGGEGDFSTRFLVAGIRLEGDQLTPEVVGKMTRPVALQLLQALNEVNAVNVTAKN